MLPGKRIAVALSGGVDSTVAAALLKDEGHDVLGLTLKLGKFSDKTVEQAGQAAEALGIPLHVVHAEAEFESTVIEPFCQDYAAGRTPNPCIICNPLIKFSLLMNEARARGCGLLATGHYSRLVRDENSGRIHLMKGRDSIKDQSYFLYRLTQEQLESTVFPNGEMTKPEVRRLARDRNLPAFKRPESQEICFIPDNDYIRFLLERRPDFFSPGEVTDEEGRVLGHHKGIAGYTIGQRRGMGIASSQPLYVLEIQPDTNRIIVGENSRLFRDELNASDVRLHVDWDRNRSYSVLARIRYRHTEAPAELKLLSENQARIRFKTPQRAVTPGQSVVFYQGDTVLGGGFIERP